MWLSSYEMVIFHLFVVHTWPEVMFSLIPDNNAYLPVYLCGQKDWCKYFCLVYTDVIVDINFGNWVIHIIIL